MFPKEVEVILARHLASCLAMPIFIIDPVGTLIFYNESAEPILGCRYEEMGEMTREQWQHAFNATDEAGNPLADDDLPLEIARREHRPAHMTFWIQGMDGVRRGIHTTAFPLIGQSDRFLGAMTIFWEVAP